MQKNNKKNKRQLLKFILTENINKEIRVYK